VSSPLTSQGLWFHRFGQPAEVLTLESHPLGEPTPGNLRIRMLAAPINPSDLIPVKGACAHRLSPPGIAGHEGVGIVTHAPDASLLGTRVLPLRGSGTWQQYVDCDAAWAVPVPDAVPIAIAARGYINPLASLLMLKRWPVSGRRLLVTAAGSACAGLLTQWALHAGARQVVGVYRSSSHRERIAALGALPVQQDAAADVAHAGAQADLIFDAVGGSLATCLLSHAYAQADFVSYGLLAGVPYSLSDAAVRPQRFHLRDSLVGIAPYTWQRWFDELWPLLAATELPPAQYFPLHAWRQALNLFALPGRRAKPMLAFDNDLVHDF